jgi:DNA polymerase V
LNRLFALVDCNNFYVSCERVFNPLLINKPVVVLSNNDGCIIARSNEAKSLNIPMGAAVHLYKDFINAHKVKVYSSNYPLYGDMSNRVMSSLADFNSDFEVYSIDEAFLKFNQKKVVDIECDIMKIKESIFKWTGIPVSIGIGPTKTLAKIANTLAKKNNHHGIFDLSSKLKQDEILKDTNVENIWGISRRWGSKLRMIGIGNAQQLRDSSPRRIRQYLGVVVERIVYELQGVVCLDINEILPKKNIMSSRSFGNLISDKAILKQSITEYTIRACEKMRNQNTRAQSVYIFLQTNKFNKGKQHNVGVVIGLNNPCSDTGQIIRLAISAIDTIYKPGYLYQKAGIMLLDLIPSNVNQYDIFETANYSSSDKRMQVIDSLNKKFGSGTIANGILKSKGKKKWSSKEYYLSPRYTTQWDELPHVM